MVVLEVSVESVVEVGGSIVAIVKVGVVWKRPMRLKVEKRLLWRMEIVWKL